MNDLQFNENENAIDGNNMNNNNGINKEFNINEWWLYKDENMNDTVDDINDLTRLLYIDEEDEENDINDWMDSNNCCQYGASIGTCYGASIGTCYTPENAPMAPTSFSSSTSLTFNPIPRPVPTDNPTPAPAPVPAQSLTKCMYVSVLNSILKMK